MIFSELFESIDLPIGTQLDLTKNFPKYATLVGKVVGQNKGKSVIEIITAVPNLGGAQVGKILEINPVYLRRAPIIK